MPILSQNVVAALALTAGAAVISFCAHRVFAQSYPGKPIRIITTDPAGAADLAARLMAPTLTAHLGQQVIIDNRPGAGSIASIETVARAAPDGHTRLPHGSPVWLMQFMRGNLPWDPTRDQAPVSLATISRAGPK